MENLAEFKKFAHYLAIKSSEVIKPYFRSGITEYNKEDSSPVTIADRKAEEVMRGLILKEFPAHGIIGEEFGNYNESADYKWILDPIDGTKSLICGALTFGTLICLMKNEEPILGVINHPILNEFLIGDNISVTVNDKQVKMRDCDSLSEAVLLTTDHLNIGKYKDKKSFEKLLEKVKLYRNWGDCYGYYLLATGFADIMIDPIMSPWDKLPLIPIIRGAGGIITDYNGNDPVKGDSIIAASKGIHLQVINILNER